MKKTFILLAVCALAMTSCGGGSSVKTDMDSVYYAIGVDIGNYLKNMNDRFEATGDKLDYAKVWAAINDVKDGKEKIDMDATQEVLREYFMVKLPVKAQAAEVAFLEKVEKENKNAIKTESGLMYEVVEPGDENVKPVSDLDKVKVVYHGTLKNGNVFDSSRDRQDTVEFALNGVIKGWTEGMKFVGKGGKIKLWIPSELGYGQRGGGSIGPNEPLMFEIDLIDVTPAEQPAEAAE